MENTQIVRAFMKHLDEFMEDMLRVYPDNKDILRGKLYFNTIRKANPSKMVKAWKNNLAIPFEKELANINNETIELILSINYEKQIGVAKESLNVKDAASLVERMKDLLKVAREESEDNALKALTYIVNLCKISKLYN